MFGVLLSPYLQLVRNIAPCVHPPHGSNFTIIQEADESRLWLLPRPEPAAHHREFARRLPRLNLLRLLFYDFFEHSVRAGLAPRLRNRRDRVNATPEHTSAEGTRRARLDNPARKLTPAGRLVEGTARCHLANDLLKRLREAFDPGALPRLASDFAGHALRRLPLQ